MLILSLLAAALPADSLRNFDIEEAVVVASPKETNQLRRQPLSVSLYDSQALKAYGANSIKGISSYAPNFYMPDYGSRITSAVYIRGIGSRINTPAVGLYVDNVPYIDKSAYDFTFADIERVDILRGPQGTLYGRNTMGGLIRVFTADPITHSGTDLSAGWTSRTGGRRASFTTYAHPATQMGLSIGGYYQGQNGFFKNSATGRKQDAQDAAGARLRWSWKPTQVVKIDWTASYEYSDEAACPYFLIPAADEQSGGQNATANTPTLAQNRPSEYRRSLFNTGLGVEHRLPRLTLSSITAWQHLRDRLFMDQDFTAQDIFSLCQKQMMNTFSEEIALKSPAGPHRWQWSTGLFGMYQYLRTDCPVTFYQDGVDMLNRQMTEALANPNIPGRLSVAFGGSELPFDARLTTPSVNVAAYHQSTLNDLGTKGLSLTVGLRLDYDWRKLKLKPGSNQRDIPYDFAMAMGTSPYTASLEADPALRGKHSHDTWQVLPKASINYTLPRSLGNVYLSVAKGYRSGGYNIQSYSDLSQTQLRRSMMGGIKQFSAETIERLPLPESAKEAATAAMNAAIDGQTPAAPDIATLYYKPEYTWSYEFGLHHNLADKMLQLDLSAFYMKTRDQQIARFTGSGLGREMVNAGRSRSCGVEVSARSQLLDDRLRISATYGYTNAEFTDYDLGTDRNGQPVDYTGNRVPFVPAHTFSASIDFRQPFSRGALKALSVGADTKGAGSVVWDEANTWSQKLYATLGARLGIELPAGLSIEAWGRNLTASRHAVFSFESMNRRFAQYGTPRHFGVDLRWHF